MNADAGVSGAAATAIPPLSDVPIRKSGPAIERLRTRAIIVWVLLCAVGTAPVVLARLGVISFSAGAQAAALGLLFPGAGLIAVGSIWCIVLGLAVLAVVMRLGATIWGMPALVPIVLWLWIVSIAGGALIRHAEPPWWSFLVLIAALTYIAISRSGFADGRHEAALRRRREHEGYLDQEAAALEARVEAARPPAARELSPDALRATRWMLGMTLREPGDFSGYQTVEQILTSALRYTLDYLGYSLALLQCAYTPSFHGYLGRAQRFIIESFTRPEVCGYWKWEYLSSLRWNPDPVRNLNVMFTGWSGLVIALYGANTGDLRYEKPGALKFRPSARSGRTYDYGTGEIIQAIARNWAEYPTRLYPCEPHLTFPQCNTFAMDAVLAWDRQHGSRILADVLPALEGSLRENFILPSGDLAFVHNTLLGFRSLADHPARADGANAFILARILNAVFPGLARRTYIFALRDYVDCASGDFTFDGTSPGRMLDDGNFKVGPAYLLGLVAAAACEMGDRPTARLMMALADRHMHRRDDPGVLAYSDGSVIGNAHIASARFAEKDDFSRMVRQGPGPGPLQGPVLTECAFPGVLVARAMSDGLDLDLVLYNGDAAGPQRIVLERLRPGVPYVRSDTNEVLKSDAAGKAELDVVLDGRTSIRISPRLS